MNKNYHVDLETLVNIISTIQSNIFFKDKDLKYVFSSHIWEQIDNGGDENFDIYGKTDREVRKDKANAKSAEEADKEIMKNGVGKRYTIKAEVDGHTQYLDIDKEPVKDENGNVIGIVGLINDVSRVSDEIKKQYEDNIREAERVAQMKSDFLANTSHEIRTPLNAILGMNDLILREFDDPKLIEYATNIKNSGNVLLALINDLLDFSKIESGRMDIVPENYYFGDFIRDIASSAKLKAYKKFLSFNSDIDTDIPNELFGDVKRISQILNNLLSNAIKYTDKGSVTLRISLVEKNDKTCKIKYEVIDTGIGIKKEDMEHIRSSFTRLEDQRNKNIEGAGLGISISDRLLKQMKSNLEIESEYGVGSTFSFVLEQTVMNNMSFGEALKFLEEKENQEVFSAPNAEILIVDDVDINLRVAQGLLTKLNMKIDTALSGQQAIEMCKTKKYDIVFMDHMMPEMNGTQAMQHIRDEADGYKDVPIIALTANSVTGAKQELMVQGFNDFVPKPIDILYITKVIKKWLPVDLIVYDFNDKQDEESIEEEAPSDTSKVLEVDVFNSTLKAFYDAIDENCISLRSYLNNGDLDNLQGKLQSIASISKTISADNLSDKASELIELAFEKKEDEVKEKFDDFITYYSGFKEKLELVLRRKNLIK